MAKPYPWYDVTKGEESLLQGDFIDDCPIVSPSQPTEIIEKGDAKVDVSKYNVVIMSQSCDLVEKKLDIVLVCPVFPLEEVEKVENFFKGKDGKEALRRGNVPGYHLLNVCDLEDFKRDYQVVDFRNVFGVPLDTLVLIAKSNEKRLRLLPPYREHLSQAFARFFMRVGLPVAVAPVWQDKA